MMVTPPALSDLTITSAEGKIKAPAVFPLINNNRMSSGNEEGN